MQKILVIDDDLSILRLIKNILTQAGYDVYTRSDVINIDHCDFIGFDLILLDIMMPLSGLDILREIRQEIKVPIIFITAKDMTEDFIEGVNAGADDYITKPFNTKELVKRVEMHLRREDRNKINNKTLTFGEVSIDLNGEAVFVEDERLNFSKREFMIIRLLCENENKFYTVEELYDRVYPQDSDTLFRSVSEYIYQIRAKFKKYNINPIETMWGGGYRWKVEKLSTN